MLRVIAGLAGGMALLSGCAAPTAPAGMSAAEEEEAQRFEDGAHIASRLCVTCHAIGPTGESRHEDAPPLRTLAERYPGSLLDEGFRQRMDVGHPMMPEFNFQPAEIDALLTYLKAIQERRRV